MLFNAGVLAIATTTGFYLIYSKLPRRLRRFLEKHSLLTDLIACILTYMFLGGTLVALLAAALVGIMISMLLHISNNPDDFMYIFDAIEVIKGFFNSISGNLNEYGKNYRAEKEEGAK
jgi:multisubunit Na+/H+ antiporter MnhB subunit